MSRKKKENQYQNDADENLEEKEDSNKRSKIRPQKKRKAKEEEKVDEENEEDNDMDSFVGDVQKALSSQLQAKRKKLSNFTSECQTSHEKVDRVAQEQTEIRRRLQEEYQKQFTCIINQWDTDFNKAKEVEDKIRTLLNQQMKLISQERQVQNQRIKSLRALHERFIESLSSAESQQSTERQMLVDEMNSKISDAQTKLLDQMEKQNRKSFRKSIATLLNEEC